MMKETIQQTTEYYLSKLQDDRSFYNPEDFLNLDFPVFLVRRIQLDLEHQLQQSLSVPETKWVDTDDKNVMEGWQQFLHAMQTAARLPADEVELLLNEAIFDITHILVEPRETIPSLLFGENSKLSIEEIREKAKWLVVYPHFERVLVRYMERKGRKELARSRCEEIIAAADEKITENYTAFQWGEMLRPLFELTNSPVKPDVLSLFFEDREMAGAAQLFEEMDSALTLEVFVDRLYSFQKRRKGRRSEEKAEYINKKEILSPTEERENIIRKSLDLQRQSEDNEPRASQADTAASDKRKRPASEEKINSERKANEPEADKDEAREQSQIRNQGSRAADEDRKEKQSSGNVSKGRSGDQSSTESSQDLKEDTFSLNDFFTDSSEQFDEEQSPAKEPPENPVNGFSGKKDRPSEAPMWQRFVDNEKDRDAKKPPSSDFGKQENDDEQNDLQLYMNQSEDYFVDSLFKGSDEAYRKTLSDISRQNEWSEAYKLVDKRIFKSNGVNMYSKEAVDFIDQLQTYFLEKKTRNIK
jgi:hypothetical protein